MILKKTYILTALLLPLLFSCKNADSKTPQAKGKVKNELIRVIRTNITFTLEENGKLAPDTTAEIKSRISGRVVNISIEEGQFVKKGEIIALIEPDLSQAQVITGLINRLEKNKITRDTALRDYRQKNTLYKKGFLSKNELNTAYEEYQKTKMDYISAKQEYELFQQETGSKARLSSRKNLSIISPISGIVLKKEVELGELISGESATRSGTLLFTIADVSQLIVNANINEVDIYNLKLGAEVSIKIPANYAETYKGVVREIAPQGETVNNVVVFPIKIVLTEHDKSLRPGMSAVITVTMAAKQNAVAIPITSLYTDGKRDYVLIPQPGTKAPQQKFVKRGINDTRYVEITQGLKKGNLIFKDIPYEMIIQNNGFIPAGERK